MSTTIPISSSTPTARPSCRCTPRRPSNGSREATAARPSPRRHRTSPRPRRPVPCRGVGWPSPTARALSSRRCRHSWLVARCSRMSAGSIPDSSHGSGGTAQHPSGPMSTSRRAATTRPTATSPTSPPSLASTISCWTRDGPSRRAIPSTATTTCACPTSSSTARPRA